MTTMRYALAAIALGLLSCGLHQVNPDLITGDEANAIMMENAMIGYGICLGKGPVSTTTYALFSDALDDKKTYYRAEVEQCALERLIRFSQGSILNSGLYCGSGGINLTCHPRPVDELGQRTSAPGFGL